MDGCTWKTSWLLSVSLLSGAPAFAGSTAPAATTDTSPPARAESAPLLRTQLSSSSEILKPESRGDWQFDAAIMGEERDDFVAGHDGRSLGSTPGYLSTSLISDFQVDMASMGLNVPHTTMAAVFSQPVGANTFAASAGWGRTSIAGNTTHNFLVEGRYTRHMRHQIFARAANVTSGGPDLIPERHSPLYPVIAGTVGYAYTRQQGSYQLGVGVSVTSFKVPPALESVYGERPLSYQIYFRLVPAERGR